MQPTSPALRDPDEWWWIFDPRQSLRARAVLIFGGLALGFSLLLGGTAETLFRRQLSRAAGPAFETLAVQIGDKLDRALDERLRALQLAARLAPLRTPAPPLAERRAIIEALFDNAPDCAWIGLTDRDGRVICAAQELFEGSAFGTSAWFRGGSRGAYVGNVREFPELAATLQNLNGDKPRFLDLAVPVMDEAGKFIGVLGAQLRWSWARDTQHSVMPETARRDHIGVTVYAAEGEALLDTDATGWNRSPDAPTVETRRGAHGYFLERVPGDTNFLTGYFRTKGYREFRGVNWLITVRQPEADAFAPAVEVRRRIEWIGGAFTAVIVVLSWIFAGRITRRMAAIATAAERIRGGDILTLIPNPTGKGELQDMCAALGDMVDDFRKKQAQLETDNLRLAARPRKTEPTE